MHRVCVRDVGWLPIDIDIRMGMGMGIDILVRLTY
jgi:hypothetical protein